MASLAPSRCMVRSPVSTRIYNFERIDACLLTSTFQRSIQAQCRGTTATSTRTTRPPSRRPFTSTSVQRFTGTDTMEAKKQARQPNSKFKNKSQPSLALVQKKTMKQQMESGGALDEMGVLPDTFIAQHSNQRPSWLTNFKDRWTYEKALWKNRLRTLAAVSYVKFYKLHTRSAAEIDAMSRLARIRYRFFTFYNFDLRSIGSIAKTIYCQMNSGLADGDLAPVQKSVKQSLLNSLQGRIAARGPNTTTVWKAHKWIEKPRLVSYTAAMMDPKQSGWDMTLVQQAVVELNSTQTLRRFDTLYDAKLDANVKREIRSAKHRYDLNGVMLPEQVREYVVLHKVHLNGKVGEWQLWGTALPTTFLDVQKENQRLLGE